MIPIIKENKLNRDGKLDFACDAVLASLIAGAINTPVLFTLFVYEYPTVFQAIGGTIGRMFGFILFGIWGCSLIGIALRILIYFLFYSKLDPNEKTGRTMAGGSLIIVSVLLAHFYLFPEFLTNDYQTFAFYTFPMLLAYNGYVWYWNIWNASNIHFRGIESAKAISKKLFY